MHYIVLDLEWNIATKHRDFELSSNEQSLNEEIIEIGAWKLDYKFNIQEKFTTNVKANFFTEINRHVNNVTNRTSESLKTGLQFPEAYHRFLEWSGFDEEKQEVLFCTWSNNDVKPWFSNIKAYDLQIPGNMRFLDVQRFFALAMVANNPGKESNKQVSVASAIEYLGIEPNLELHKAVNDALYTSLILKKTVEHLQDKALMTYNYENIFSKFYKYSYDISVNYKDKFELAEISKVQELENIAENTAWRCPECTKKLEMKHKWKKARGGKKLNNSSFCLEHGPIYIKLTCFQLKQDQQNQQINNPYKVKAEVKIDWMYHPQYSESIKELVKQNSLK